MALTNHIATQPPIAAAGPLPGMTAGSVRAWLRIEGLAGLIAGIALFAGMHGEWLFLVPLLLLPDVSAIGFLGGPRTGAFTYNLLHTWAPGLIVLGIAAALGSTAVGLVGAALVAHVGMDRAVGYGLKLPTSFQDTHLGRIGRRPA